MKTTHIRECLNQGDMERVGNFRDPLSQVVLKEVLKFGSKLDTSWTTTDDNLDVKSGC